MPTRLDKLVSERFSLSRRAAQDAVRNGRIDLDGLRCDEPGREVEVDADVGFFPNRPKARKVAGRLRVLYEDRYVIIVDKPAGVLTLPTPEGEHDTLLSRVAHYLSIRHGGRPFAGIVHRLDRDTSGALALAKTPESARAFQALFKAHDIERQYLTVVEGVVARESGTIDLNLVTDRGDLRRGVGAEAGRGASGRSRIYRVAERFASVATLVACWLETGRTHQIRIHLAEMGHPVVGDPVYRPREQPRCKAHFHRQALHAQTLGFVHPITREKVRVEAPLPPDLAELIVDLRNRFGIVGAGG